MLCLVSAFPECLALFVWNPVWFSKLSFPIAYTQKESCIFYLDFPGFVDLCLLSKWVLTEVLILQIISRSLVFIEIDTTWLLSIKGVLGGNPFNSQTFCILYSFQKGYIYLFYFKNWEEEHTYKGCVCRGGTNVPARVEVRGQLRGQFFPSKCALWGSVQYSAEPSLQTSWIFF